MAIVKVDRGETENCLYKVDNVVQPVFQSRINYQKKDYTHILKHLKPDLCLMIRKKL